MSRRHENHEDEKLVNPAGDPISVEGTDMTDPDVAEDPDAPVVENLPDPTVENYVAPRPSSVHSDISATRTYAVDGIVYSNERSVGVARVGPDQLHPGDPPLEDLLRATLNNLQGRSVHILIEVNG